MVRFIQQRFFHKHIFENKKRNILIVSVFDIDENKYKYIKNYQGEKGLYITEPIKNLSSLNDNYYWVYKLYIENCFDYIFGCIENNDSNQFKYPLYLNENNFNIEDKSVYDKLNNYVKNTNIETLKNKNFCCLINSWDTPAKTRTVMYENLINIKHISCPGKLFNNCSNRELNRIGKRNYIKKFIFNICSENFDNANINGYITEKLMDCCLGGAIPIYCGWFDEIDGCIFNKERIIFYDSSDQTSINKAFTRVQQLVNNKEELYEFYKKPIFCENAHNIVYNMQTKLGDFLNYSSNKIKTFVICNKEKESERFDYLNKQIKTLGIDTFLEIKILDNLTWSDDITDNFITTMCKTDKSMIQHGRTMSKKPLSKAEISLFMNHLNCLEYIVKNVDNENCLILESDIIFKRGIRNNLFLIRDISKRLKNWDIINIGEGQEIYMKSLGYPKTTPYIIDGYKMYPENISRCAEAIYWNYHSISKILSKFYLEKDINGPFDTYLDVFSSIEYNNFNIYWSENTSFVQGSIKRLFKSHLR